MIIPLISIIISSLSLLISTFVLIGTLRWERRLRMPLTRG